MTTAEEEGTVLRSCKYLLQLVNTTVNQLYIKNFTTIELGKTVQLTITKKIAACTVYQHALWDIEKNRWCSGQTTLLSPLRFRVRSPVRWTRTQSSCEKSKVNTLPKVVGFLRVLRFPPTGKLTGWDRYHGPTVIGSRCCGDPALVAKLNK